MYGLSLFASNLSSKTLLRMGSLHHFSQGQARGHDRGWDQSRGWARGRGRVRASVSTSRSQ